MAELPPPSGPARGLVGAQARQEVLPRHSLQRLGGGVADAPDDRGHILNIGRTVRLYTVNGRFLRCSRSFLAIWVARRFSGGGHEWTVDSCPPRLKPWATQLLGPSAPQPLGPFGCGQRPRCGITAIHLFISRESPAAQSRALHSPNQWLVTQSRTGILYY